MKIMFQVSLEFAATIVCNRVHLCWYFKPECWFPVNAPKDCFTKYNQSSLSAQAWVTLRRRDMLRK